MRLLLAGWLIAGFAGVALAADAPAAVAVIIRPFAGEDDLAIYGKPVADEVAAGLQRAGVKAEVVVGDAKGDVVVELRAVKVKKLVRLEATLHGWGEALDKASAKPVKIAQLGLAAAQLARALAPKIASVKPKSNPKPEPEPVATPVPEKPPTPPPASAPVPAPDSRAAIVVAAPVGLISGVEIKKLGIEPMRGVLERAGYRAVESGHPGMVPPEVAGKVAKEAGARATIMVQILSTNIVRKIVFYGRGRIQVVAVRDDGQVLFNRIVDTDTVVGSRTEGPDVLVGFMIRQAMEIVARDLAKALKR